MSPPLVGKIAYTTFLKSDKAQKQWAFNTQCSQKKKKSRHYPICKGSNLICKKAQVLKAHWIYIGSFIFFWVFTGYWCNLPNISHDASKFFIAYLQEVYKVKGAHFFQMDGKNLPLSCDMICEAGAWE